MVVDPLLLIHLNSLVNDELNEQRYYLPQKQLLIDNKDKELFEQEAHIQVSAIKSKLISFTKFLSFLETRKICIGLDESNIKHLINTSNYCKSNLSELSKEQQQTMKRFKFSILIISDSFKQYGCLEHIIKPCKVIKEIQKIQRQLLINQQP